MLPRLGFAMIALFWAVMNVLLWRSEFKGENELGSTVPVEAVWTKILTAPDDSALEIARRELKIGYCRWRANVGEEVPTGKAAAEDYLPEGMVKRLSGYTIDFEGNLLMVESATRLRFEFHGGFTADHQWKDWVIRVSIRPKTLEIQGSAVAETVNVTVTDGSEKWQRRFRFAELHEPMKLLREFGLPLPADSFSLWTGVLDPKNLALGLPWRARNDWLKIGHSQVRVYRLEARLLDHYQASVIVSRVGEILRVELPNGIVLENDALINL